MSFQIDSISKRSGLSLSFISCLLIQAFQFSFCAGYNWNRYVVIEDQTFIDPVPVVYNGYDSVIYRRCEFRDRITERDNQVFHFTNIGILKFENCTFKNLRKTGSGDYHGINANTNIDSLFLLNCSFENISADAIQIGNGIYNNVSENYINYVLIDSCVFITPEGTSSENGIDWKGGCKSLGIIQNCKFKGFRFCEDGKGCTGSNGEAIVVHYGYSRNLIIRNNTINDCLAGIVISQGSAGGNEIYEQPPKNIVVSENIISCEAFGIQLRKAENLFIKNNILYNTETGISLSEMNGGRINNNTLVNCWNDPLVEYVPTTGETEYTNNLIAGECDGVWMDMAGSNNIQVENISEVNFLDAENHDYHLTENSIVAIDKGINNGLDFDIDGEPRLNNGIMDVGADEYHSGTEVPDDDDFPVEVIPNPSTGIFVVTTNTIPEESISLNLIDINGKTVFSGSFRGSTIELYHKWSGYYIVEVKAGNRKTCKEVLIVNQK